MAKIKINGVTMPPVKSLSIEDEPIWSAKTGRTANGKMKGSIIAHKDKLNIVFVPMSSEQAKIVKNAVSSAFFDVTYEKVDGTVRTAKFYAGPTNYTVYSYADEFKKIKYTDVSVNLIEQ